jgi:hypothetical protein
MIVFIEDKTTANSPTKEEKRVIKQLERVAYLFMSFSLGVGRIADQLQVIDIEGILCNEAANWDDPRVRKVSQDVVKLQREGVELDKSIAILVLEMESLFMHRAYIVNLNIMREDISNAKRYLENIWAVGKTAEGGKDDLQTIKNNVMEMVAYFRDIIKRTNQLVLNHNGLQPDAPLALLPILTYNGASKAWVTEAVECR